MITLEDILTSSGKYPDRSDHVECTEEVRSSASELVDKVSSLMLELGITARVSSGFRTAAVNGSIPFAAKKSKHMTGNAVDLEDVSGIIDELLMANLDVLEKYGLYLEHPDATPTWAHLQQIAPKSGKRVFRP